MNTNNFCDQCDSSYFYYHNDDQKGVCEKCSIDNCEVCDTDPLRLCDICLSPFHGVNVPNCCAVSNCGDCSSDPLNTCDRCSNGYFAQSPYTCSPCSVGFCVTCDSSPATVCDDCLTGYSRDETGSLCTACSIENCDSC